MCDPIIGMIAMAAAAGVSAKASYDQGQVAKQVGRNNATMAEYAAQDAQKRGEEDAAAIQRKGAALKSAQRVSMATKGLDLSYGTAADLQDQTDFFTQSDAATARTNAGRDAWSMRARGQQAMFEGNAAARNAKLQATGTLLSGAGQVSDKWSTYKASAGAA